jgi:CheY-like chemotaxis protein
MSVITIFSGTFCNTEAVMKALVSDTGRKLMTDRDIVERAALLSGIAGSKIERVFSPRASVFNKFTHEKERSIAYLRLAMAKTLSEDNLVISGFSGQLIPREIHHVLHVCLIAELKFRVQRAIKALNVSESEAVKLIAGQEEARAAWIKALWGKADPWDAKLYDMVLPTDKKDVNALSATIVEHADSSVVRTSARSMKAVDDFMLAAQVEVELVHEGHQVGVSSKNGVVALTINKHVLMLNRLESDLKTIASKVPGVQKVETRVGPGFHQADIYRKQDFNMPSKILLVDDEREFVQTLSERLLMREMGSAIAYDGESALEVAREDEPDVMILDLKMPGIDGMEVLRRVKATQPQIEVIILTGHGSEADKETCMKLGAFAYLQKPVDVEELSATIKLANEKIQRSRASR